MNFWKSIYIKWSGQELAKWNSFRKTAYLILPLLIYFLVHDGMEVLLWAGLNHILTTENTGLAELLTKNADTVRGGINGLAILAGVLAIWPALKQEIAKEEDTLPAIDKKTETGSQKSDMTRRVNNYILLAVLAFLSAFGLNLLFHVIGLTSSSASYNNTARAQYGVNFIAGLALYGILSPIAEEAVFRGLIYNRMKRCFGIFLGGTVSALLFGCYHGNLVQGIYGTVLGLLIAYLYEKYGSFAAPALFHSVANVSVYVMTYYKSLADMSRAVSIGAMTVFLLGAVFCLWYIQKNIYFDHQK